MKKLALTALPAALMLVLTGCQSMNAGTAASDKNSVGMANPASVYCVEEKGGKLEVKKDEEVGDYGVCHLPDGTIVEEWTLYRQDNPL